MLGTARWEPGAGTLAWVSRRCCSSWVGVGRTPATILLRDALCWGSVRFSGWLVGWFFHRLCCLTLVFRWCWPHTVSVVPLGDVSTAVMSILKVWWNLKCQIIWIWCFSFGHLAVVLEQSLFKFWKLILLSENLKFMVLFVSFTVSALSAAASFLQLQVFAYFASKFFLNCPYFLDVS